MSSSTSPFPTTPLLPLAPSPRPTLSSHLSSLPLLSSPLSPFHSLLPPLPTSTTPLHPPPRPTQLRPLPPLPPPLTLPLLSSSNSSSSRLLEDSHTPFLASLYLDLRGFPVLGATSTPTIFTPSTFQEAITCPDVDKWIAEIFQECEAFIRNDSFVDVPLPADANLVEGKWVFRVKQLPGEEPVYKARYCAKSFTQTWAEDYWFIFAPSAKPPTLRTLLDIGAHDEMEICSMDVSNAFLQGNLHESIFLRRPPGSTPPFLRTLCGSCVDLLFLRSSPRRFFILVYMDGMILLANSKADMEQMKQQLQQLQQRLKCKDLDDLTHYLGMAIMHDRPARTITLSQSHYIGQLAPPTSPSSSPRPYAELVGSLMYAMMCTRPDLAYPISVLARFVGTGRHTEVHWKTAKRVLRYLRGTKDHALTLGGPSPPLLLGFSDSSWADSQPDHRSS
ncbi:unnamed protein product [Closterium sp. NIES-53]